MRRRASLALLAAFLQACEEEEAPARAQWLVFVGTDAVVPQMGDRLLVEVVDAAGVVCDGCRRHVAAGAPDAWPLSLGIIAPPDGERRGIRARLLRAEILGPDGFPRTDRYLDGFAWLPPAEGVTRVALSLPMACFGRLASPEADRACDARTGVDGPAAVLASDDRAQDATLRPGSWSWAGPRGCDGVSADEGMVCVPGGAFLLGSPDFSVVDRALRPSPEQLVAVAPFLLDVDEVTAATMASLVAGDLVATPFPGSDTNRCTFGFQPDRPINCVTREEAAAACAALGKRLATEAEWEYVATNLDRESRRPWLDEAADPCAKAVVDQRSGVCSTFGDDTGPVAAGAPTDVTLLGVRNLGGNVAEWVAGGFLPYEDPACWGADADLLVDPLCLAGGAPIARGSSWIGDARALDVSSRSTSEGVSVAIGFRCAKSL